MIGQKKNRQIEKKISCSINDTKYAQPNFFEYPQSKIF